MKAGYRWVLWVLLLVLTSPGYSQHNAATIGGSFAKFVDIPVSHFTGVPNISVPLHTVSEGSLAAPIALQYHSSGIKLGELASDVGLGWYLQGGGAIYRTVRGIPDEEREYDSNLNRKGYQYYGADLDPGSDLQDVANLETDGEPDLFTFVIPGGSGKFVFTGGNSSIISGITTIPYQDIKIEVVDGGCGGGVYCRINGFILTTSDGTRYFFGKYDPGLSSFNVEVTVDNNLPLYEPLKRYHSVWYLTKIETHDGLNSIDYTYLPNNYAYRTLVPCGLKLLRDPNGSILGQQVTCDNYPNLPGTEIYYNEFSVNSKILDKIITRTDTVEFSHDTRTDVQDLPNDGLVPLQIDGFEVKMGMDHCLKYEFDQGYFTDGGGSEAFRKRLRLDRVRKKACDNSITEPDYVFTYNSSTTLPHRLSKAMDHWGYYNGITGNNLEPTMIPPTTLETSDGQATFNYGSANRNPFFNETRKGILEKIEYPTGGQTEFTYEANMAFDPNAPGVNMPIALLDTGSLIGNCTPLTYTVEKTVSLTADMITYGKAKLGIQTHYGYCGVVNTEVVLEIIQTFGTVTLSFDDTLTGSTTNPFELNNLGLSTGSTTFRLTVNRQGVGYAHVTYHPTMGVEGEAGGLRIKQIKTYDGFSHSRDIIKDYTYIHPINSQSSGRYVGRPLYGIELPSNNSNISHIVVAESHSLAPLYEEEGYHIGYTYVQEAQNGNGTTEYIFRNVESFDHNPTEYPPFPRQRRILDGTLAGMGQKTETGTELTFLNQVHEQDDDYYNLPNLTIVSRIVNDVSIYYTSEVRFPRNRYPVRNQYQLSMLDGVETEAVTGYDDPLQLGPTSMSSTNSDGQVYTTEITYASDYTVDPAIKEKMDAENRHMFGLPYKTEIFTVDGMTPIQIDGQETRFSFFNNSTGIATSDTSGQIYPHEIRRYEGTWNAAGTWQPEGYRTLQQISEYHMSFGLPERSNKSGWTENQQTYDGFGNLIQSKFSNFETNYNYFPNSKILRRKEAVDGQFMAYTYDALVRPLTVKDSCANVITTMGYVFKDATNANYNKTTTTTVYPSVSGSAVGTIVDVEYMDGLGRSVQSVRKDQAQASGVDIVHAQIYDDQGRASKVFEPQRYPGNNGDFVSFTTIDTGDYTLTEYEASPLNRVGKVTPPFLSPIEYIYGENNATYVSGYAANLLHKTQVEDGNGNFSISFTDRRGRKIQSTRTDGTLKNSTLYTYDDKDRLIQALPPGTTSANTNLIYSYTYDERDQVLTKKVPNKAVMDYRYNTRDLLSYVQDGYLRGLSKWYGYNYDVHGREIESGFANTAGNNNTHVSAVIQEELTTNTYGTSAHEIDKLKTIESKIMGMSDWLETTHNYDVCGRITSSVGNSIVNLAGTSSQTRTYSYDWMDNMLSETLVHLALGNTQTIVQQYTYDKVGRQDLYKHKLNDGSLKTITNFDFNHKDELTQVAMGPISQQIINYTYKPNGLLATMNSTSLGDDLFYEELLYNTTVASSGAVAQHNGNIANVISRVKGSNQQVYGMTYDYLDRLDKATFVARDSTGSSQISNSLNNYTVDPSYDVRGNIEALIRYGQYWNGNKYVAAVIDDLDYVLDDNQITSIADNAPDSSKRYGYQEGTGNYAYDGNGNMTTDPRSGATFTYNHLDLPNHADFGDGKTIDWIYDAHGNMVEKLVKNGATTMERRRYTGEIEYGGDQIEVIYHDAGRIYNTDYVPEFKKIEGTITGTQSVEAVSIASTARIHDAANVDYTAEEFIELESDFEVESGTDFDATILTPLTPDTSWRYDFFIKDHLGNTRVVFNEAENILAHYEYYPFGMQRNGDWGANTGLNNEKYQYNGIEYVQDHGLNMNVARYRMLDPSIGRWMGVDPRAENDMAGSPYNSMYNDPLSYTDPEGDCPFCWILPFLGNILPTATVTASAITATASVATAVAVTAAVAAVTIPTLSPVATPISSTLPSVQQIYSGTNYGYVDQAYDPSSNTLTKFGEIPAKDGYGTLYRTNTGYWKSSDAFLIKGESIGWVNSYATLAGLGGIQGVVGAGFGFAVTTVGVGAFFTGLKLANSSISAAKIGTTVLGKYPQYIELASKLNARRFNIPSHIWSKMSPAEQWSANVKFLDRTIARGDKIFLSNRVTNINQVSGYFRRELDYLISKGYRISNSGTQLIR